MNDKCLVFKSTPDNWEKEKKGIKNDTVREDDGGWRFVVTREMLKSREYCDIVLVNTETLESFRRSISDITPFKESLYVYSWR
jgi:hypothetical protein